MKKLWILEYHHRHGVDVSPYMSADSSPPDGESVLPDFEPERDDEWTEWHGPYQVSDLPDFK